MWSGIAGQQHQTDEVNIQQKTVGQKNSTNNFNNAQTSNEWDDFYNNDFAEENSNTARKDYTRQMNPQRTSNQQNKSNENSEEDVMESIMKAGKQVGKTIVKGVNKTTDTLSQMEKPTSISEIKESKKVPKRLVPDIIDSCQDEKTIKHYKFAITRKNILSSPCIAMLEVTNKRVIYHLHGNNKYSHSELPIDDVSSVTIESTTGTSFRNYMLLWLMSCYTSGVIALPSSWFKPYAIIAGIIGVVLAFTLLIRKSYKMAYLCSSLSFYSILFFTANSLNRLVNASGLLAGVFFYVLLILYVITFILAGKQKYVSLIIRSKGGMSSPINCINEKLSLIETWGKKSVEPTQDTDLMTRELGAMISDIQKLGDYGIEKWSNKSV